MKVFCTSVLLLLFSILSSAQSWSDDLPPEEPGKCYTRHIIEGRTEITRDTLGPFSPEDEIPQDILEEVYIEPESARWVPVRDTSTFSGSSPYNKMWCLRERPDKIYEPEILNIGPAETMERYVVVTTSVVIEDDGLSDWVQVICKEDINEHLIRRIENALNAEGFELGISRGKFSLSRECKAALMKFQELNQFPLGHLDMETMDALGVAY